MQRIKIYEKDNTMAQKALTISKTSVFLPGFASNDGAKVGELHECRTLSEFYGFFGEKAPKFVGEENYYPYAESPSPRETLSGTGDQTLEKIYSARDDATTGITLKLENTTLYSETKAYSIGDQCLYIENGVKGLYKCKNNISGKEWSKEDWGDNILIENNIVLVKKDSLRSNKSSFYELNIENTLQWASFKFLQYEGEQGFPKVAIPLEEGSDLDPSQVKMFNANDSDPSWLMAEQYLSLGLAVTYVRMNKIIDSESADYDVTPRRAYEFMIDFFGNIEEMSQILDKGEYNIQFLTSGGYPVLEHSAELAGKMISIAKGLSEEGTTTTFNGRGDCLVLLDHTNNPYRDLIGPNSLFDGFALPVSQYAAVYTPWCRVGMTNLKFVPASFIYLYTLGSHQTTGNTWTIYAGIGNGRCSIIQKLNTEKILTNKIAEYYQNDYGISEIKNSSINAITYIRNYGYCIWGNRTCERYTSSQSGFALSFVNIRNLVSEVKKRAYFVSQQLMFEVNGDTLWAKFTSGVASLLETMKSGNGLENYAFVKNTTDDKTQLSAAIILYPTYGVESVEIFIKLEDNNTTVEESSSEE